MKGQYIESESESSSSKEAVRTYEPDPDAFYMALADTYGGSSIAGDVTMKELAIEAFLRTLRVVPIVSLRDDVPYMPDEFRYCALPEGTLRDNAGPLPGLAPHDHM